MKCDACAATIPDDAVFCSACGTDVARRSDHPASPPEHEIALAAANLLRVRKRFNEAEARCVEVLRSDPNNVHAHSLLGDIYLDQGRREDARQWYQLALDLDPRSRSDRRKLLALRGDGATDLPPDPEDRLAGVSSLTWVRFVGLVLAVFVLGAVGSIIARNWSRPAQRVAPATAVVAPELRMPSEQAPPRAVTRTQVPQQPEVGEPDQAASSEIEATDSALVDIEVQIADGLSIAGTLSPATQVVAVMLSESGRSGSLVLRHSADAGATSEQVESQIAVDAMRAVHGALQRAENLSRLDVVVRLDTPTLGEYTALRARADRAKVAQNTSVADAQKALRGFTWYVWTPAWRSYQSSGLETPGR